jgi:hypothetical protein
MPRRGRAAARSASDLTDAPGPGGREPKDKMTVLLSSPVRRKLRVAAAVQDRDMSEVIEDAVQLYLDTWERERAARGLAPLTVE